MTLPAADVAAAGVRVPGDLPALLRRAAMRWPEQVAWVFDPGDSLTFSQVEARTIRLAAGMSACGVGAGDRVGVMLGNRAELPLIWLALARTGAAMVALNPRYGDADLDHVLGTARCRALVGIGPQHDRLASLPAQVPGRDRLLDGRDLETDGPSPTVSIDAATVTNIQFTSGTTGRPKGCLLTHDYWLRLAGSLVQEFPRLTPTDVMLTAQAFHYIDPMWNTVAGLLSGARLVVLDGFHPSSFWSKVREHAVTYFYCLGAMPTLLLAQPPAVTDRDHRVRAVQCSAIPAARHAEIEARWGVAWYEAFGMTETGADLRVTDRDHDELVGTGCVGAPAAHRRAAVLGPGGEAVATGESGELVLHGPGMMTGYLDDPAATAEAFRDGWFHTGDLARLDVDGRVYLTGRSKDMIRRGGENIAAREVEETLSRHPGVLLAAVLAVPDELRGEEVKAVLVAPGVEPAALAVYCGQQLAPYKVPRYWEFRDSLPLTASLRVAKPGLASAQRAVYDRVADRWSAPGEGPAAATAEGEEPPR